MGVNWWAAISAHIQSVVDPKVTNLSIGRRNTALGKANIQPFASLPLETFDGRHLCLHPGRGSCCPLKFICDLTKDESTGFAVRSINSSNHQLFDARVFRCEGTGGHCHDGYQGDGVDDPHDLSLVVVLDFLLDRCLNVLAGVAEVGHSDVGHDLSCEFG